MAKGGVNWGKVVKNAKSWKSGKKMGESGEKWWKVAKSGGKVGKK